MKLSKANDKFKNGADSFITEISESINGPLCFVFTLVAYINVLILWFFFNFINLIQNEWSEK